MKAAIAFSIALHRINQLVSFFIEGSTGCLEVFTSLGEIVIIDEVIACVIGRVYVNHLDCAQVILSEYFEHIKIIALDVKIFCVPKIQGSIKVGTKSLIVSLICKARRSTLIRPSELIAFLCTVEQILRQLIAELVEINGKFRLAVFI